MTKRFLALDVGEKRIGIAISDPLGITVTPLETLDRQKSKVLDKLAELAVQKDISGIVLGLPYELDGTIGAWGEKVLAFQKKLQGKFYSNPKLRGITFHSWDERFSSEGAERFMGASPLRGKERREARDGIAAALILESFLASLSR